MVEELTDARRIDAGYLLGERAMLDAWLEWHRTTLLLKCEGLTDEDRKRRPVTTSKLSLHGLVRHMAEVENNWFNRVLLRDPSVPYLWADDAVDDSELVPLDDADWAADLARWRQVCEASRRNAAPLDLDHRGLRRGQDCSLRWIYLHMIEEYARHNGHADLLRELIDGAVGD